MAETLPAYQYFKFKEDLGHPEALLNEYYQLYFTPNLRVHFGYYCVHWHTLP